MNNMKKNIFKIGMLSIVLTLGLYSPSNASYEQPKLPSDDVVVVSCKGRGSCIIIVNGESKEYRGTEVK